MDQSCANTTSIIIGYFFFSGIFFGYFSRVDKIGEGHLNYINVINTNNTTIYSMYFKRLIKD